MGGACAQPRAREDADPAAPPGESAGAALAGQIPAAVDQAAALMDSERQAFTPMLAILSAQHEAQARVTASVLSVAEPATTNVSVEVLLGATDTLWLDAAVTPRPLVCIGSGLVIDRAPAEGEAPQTANQS